MTPKPPSSTAKGTPIIGIVAFADGHVTKAADKKSEEKK